jgi:hypothetical protein
LRVLGGRRCAVAESGGTKVARGAGIAVGIVAAIVLLAVFYKQIGDALAWAWDYLTDQFPKATDQAVVVTIYLLLAVVLSVLFSRAGHFTAYGIVIALWPLLWFLFWEGFPKLGLDPTWLNTLGVSHLAPGPVILWAIVADLIITIIFVPLELREKAKRRR